MTGKDFLKDPGIKSTMLGDGIATMLASFIGGPPNTTYSEVTGAVALTRAFNPGVMTWAAIWAIVLSCVNKLGAFLSSIPVPVMGDHDSAVRGHHGGGPEHAGPRWRRLDGPATSPSSR